MVLDFAVSVLQKKKSYCMSICVINVLFFNQKNTSVLIPGGAL